MRDVKETKDARNVTNVKNVTNASRMIFVKPRHHGLEAIMLMVILAAARNKSEKVFRKVSRKDSGHFLFYISEHHPTI